MRPSSSMYVGGQNKETSYEDEKNERLNTWESEVSDVLAKIKGSSLKKEDKELAIKRIHSQIILFTI